MNRDGGESKMASLASVVRLTDVQNSFGPFIIYLEAILHICEPDRLLTNCEA
jgi:hypothetical protein